MLFTPEFVRQFTELLNAHEEWLSKTKGLTGSLTFRETGYKDWLLKVVDGKVVEFREGDEKGELTIEADSESWERICSGKLSLTKAFVLRKLKIKGSAVKFARFLDPALKYLPGILKEAYEKR